MNLYPDSKDLINLISKNQPMSPADFANLLRANNWALAFSFVNVAEVMIREDLPLCRERLRVIETLPARFIQVFTNIVKLELQAAVEAVNSSQEFVRPDPYVDRWHQTYTPPGRADYQEMLVTYRLEDQVIPLVYGNPAILQNVRSGGDFYRAAVAQDRNAADRERRSMERFSNSVEVHLRNCGLFDQVQDMEGFVTWLSQDPERCPSLQFFNAIYLEFAANVQDLGCDSDPGDLAHISTLPYVDAMTIDRRYRDYTTRAIRRFEARQPRLDYSRRIFAEFRVFARSI